MSGQHTPEPWRIGLCGTDAESWPIEDDSGYVHITDAHPEDARRIVAAVNACKRFRTELLEAAAACGGITEDPTASQLKAEQQRDKLQVKWDYYQNFVKAHGVESITELVVQRDELLAAMKMIEHATEPSHDDGAYHENAYSLAVAAIAKVKP